MKVFNFGKAKLLRYKLKKRRFITAVKNCDRLKKCIIAAVKNVFMKPVQTPDKKLGILGGGQLGRMLIQKAIDFNIQTSVMDPDAAAPCGSLADEFTQGDFTDFDTVYHWGKNLKLITVEIENVNASALQKLADDGVEVWPQPYIIKIVQDKGLQKLFYREHHIPSSEFVLIENRKELKALKKSFPFILKTRKAGYDGKGVMKVSGADDLEFAFDEPCVLENYINIEKEISLIVARNKDGHKVHYPPVEMEFNKEANLVEYTFSPSSLSSSISEKATNIALNIIEELKMVGLLAVEMFVTADGEVLVNEMAPRPHNSGHQTIEGNATSQYEQHLRAIFNYPLGPCDIHRPVVMVNLLGEKNHSGPARYEGLNDVLAIPGTYIHLYGKKNTKPFRKMGHVTVTASDIKEAKKIAKKVKGIIKVIS
jgi:5-(carboxyamino)imidazole ribonucleotide synthase